MEWLTKSWDYLLRFMSTQLFSIGDTPVNTFGVVRLLIVIILAFWVSRLASRAIQRVGARHTSFNTSSLYALSKLLQYVILLLGLVFGLNSIGVNFSSLAIFAGALGVGVGIGLQNLISNFVSGIIILIERSLKVGDFVELESGPTGEVREINIRSTVITTNDNVDIVVPNSEFINGRMINWTMREAHRRVHVPFGVAYGTDKDLVRKAVLEAANNVPHTLKTGGHAPQVWLVGFGDSSLNFELVVWLRPEAVKRPSAVSADYLWAIETAFGKNGIEIPFPQRDLHLRSVFGSHQAEALKALSQQRDESAD